MTTQELKNKIEKVLGNSIRCLLPSYWWKNLFHSVADRIDEVETTITENVNDMVVKSLKEFETKHPDMASNTLYFTEDKTSAEARSNATKLLKWALSITDKPSGTIGNTLYVAVPVLEAEYNSFSHVIQSPVFRLAVGVNSESTVEFLNVPMSDGQNYNIVFGVNSGVATLQPASSSDGGSVMFVVDPLGSLTEEQKQINSDAFLKVLEAEGAIDINIMVMIYIAKPNMVSVNDNGDLVLVAAGIDGGASKFIFTPEGDVTIETVEPTSSGGVEIRELYIYEDISGNITELTEEQKAWNLETFEFFVEKKAIVRYRMSNYQWFYLDTLDNGYMRSYIATAYGVVCVSLNVDEEGLAYASTEAQTFDDTVSMSNKAVQSKAVKTALDGKQDSLVSGINIKTINNQSILGSGNITIEGGSNVTIDSAMSSTSTNPVQNKVVYSELQKKQGTINDLADIRSGAALGKTALQQADIADLATKDDITNLTNGIIANEEVHAAALNDLEERKADKEYVEDALGNVDLSAKQDKINDLDTIRSGAALGATAIQSVKTINGESIEGEGDIVIKADADTSTLVTKDEFTDVEEVWAASYNLLNQKISDVQQYIYDEAASRRQFDEAIAEIQSILAENESVITAAWNQLNTRINALEAAQRG